MVNVRGIVAENGNFKSEEIWLLRVFFTVSMVPADLHPDNDFWSVSIIWGKNNGN